MKPPAHLPFDATFRKTFRDLVLWRRDVRRFRTDPVPEKLIDDLIELATHAPSVGLSQPWRFVKVKSPERRRAVWESFAKANERALGGYEGEQKANYSTLKLAGLKEAPIHLAVFSDKSTATGSGLGRQTMPETLRYSVVAAVQTMWLGARAEGLGMGWVSILDPDRGDARARRAGGLAAGRLSRSRLAGGGAHRSRARAPSLGAAPLHRRSRLYTLTICKSLPQSGA